MTIFFVGMPEGHFLVSGAVWFLAEGKKRLSAIIKDVDETCARYAITKNRVHKAVILSSDEFEGLLSPVALYVLIVSMPEVERITAFPAQDIGPAVHPLPDLFEPGIGVVRASAQLYDETELFCVSPAAAVAAVGFNGFIDKGVQKFIKSILAITENDDLPVPFGKLANMFLFSESLFHVQ